MNDSKQEFLGELKNIVDSLDLQLAVVEVTDEQSVTMPKHHAEILLNVCTLLIKRMDGQTMSKEKIEGVKASRRTTGTVSEKPGKE